MVHFRKEVGSSNHHCAMMKLMVDDITHSEQLLKDTGAATELAQDAGTYRFKILSYGAWTFARANENIIPPPALALVV